jgi:hypothetical protein
VQNLAAGVTMSSIKVSFRGFQVVTVKLNLSPSGKKGQQWVAV